MGSDKIKWYPHTPLTIDNGFTLAGYQTDKTQIFWLGTKMSIPESLQSAHSFCVDMQAIDEYPVLAKGFDLPLEEGMVLAIEPKIGIADIGMVGTENTFEVTPQGGQSITGNSYEILTV